MGRALLKNYELLQNEVGALRYRLGSQRRQRVRFECRRTFRPMPFTRVPGCVLLCQPTVHATGMARPTAHDVRPCSTSSVWRPLEYVVPACPIAGRSTAAAPSTETEALSPIKRTAKRVPSQT